MLVGTVDEVWRHPVKSLGGERLDSCPVDARGLRRDRWWALRDPDGKLGSGKSTRRFRAMPGLLELSARLNGERADIVWPDGSTASSEDAGLDARLSEYVGRPVVLATEEGTSHLDEAPVHLVTTASLDWLAQRHGRPVDVRRLRPNLLVSSPSPRADEHWVGRTVQIGMDVVVRVTHRTERCVMTTQRQADLPTDRGVLRTISAEADLCFGVHADVVRTGTVHSGDSVHLLDRDDPLHHAESLRA
jgi:uncharacterized protein YcbX